MDENGILLVNGKAPADDKPQVTDRTKFNVIGAIPEIKDGDDPKTVDRIQRLLDHRAELEKAARERGIRVISLEDFLTYLGYKPKKRLFVPGSDVPDRPKPKAARASAFGGR